MLAWRVLRSPVFPPFLRSDLPAVDPDVSVVDFLRFAVIGAEVDDVLVKICDSWVGLVALCTAHRFCNGVLCNSNGAKLNFIEKLKCFLCRV